MYLRQLAQIHPEITLKLLDENKGVAGGKVEAHQFLESDYVSYIDNDFVFFPGYFERMLSMLQTHPDVAGICPKVVLPGGLIQLCNPGILVKDEWVIFSDKFKDYKYDNPSTLTADECDWVPGGANLWRRQVLEEYAVDPQIIGSYEDNEQVWRMSQSGVKFMSCPSSIVLHIRADFAPGAMQIQNYTHGRYNPEKHRFAVKYFYQKHGKIFSFGFPDEFAKTLGFDDAVEYSNFVKS